MYICLFIIIAKDVCLWYGLLLGAETAQIKAESSSKCIQCIRPMCYPVKYALPSSLHSGF